MEKFLNQLKEVSFLKQLETPFIPIDTIESVKNENMNDYFTNNKLDNSVNTSEINTKSIKFLSTKHKTSFITYKKKETKTKNSSGNGRWKKQERIQFAVAIWKYGIDWKKIIKSIPSRTTIQIRSHAQKFHIKLKNNNFLIKTAFNFSLNFKDTIEKLRQFLGNEEFFKFLISIESELGDNNRETQKYIERNKKSDNNLNIGSDTYNESTFFDSEVGNYKYNNICEIKNNNNIDFKNYTNIENVNNLILENEYLKTIIDEKINSFNKNFFLLDCLSFNNYINS